MDWQSTWEDEPNDTSAAWERALAVMFSLASAARHHPRPSRYYWNRALRARGIPSPVPKAFWLRLMQSAALLDALPGGEYRPTALLPQWLARPASRQAADLVEAWVYMASSVSNRQSRRRIVRKLGHPLGPQPLTPSEQRQISALRLLGIWDDATSSPTALGRHALSVPRRGRESLLPQHSLAPAWQVSRNSLRLSHPYPRHLPLLWELEAFLQPYAPGRYLLTPSALRLAAQRGSLTHLAEVLERGSVCPLSPELRACVLDLPQARLLTGSVLEFDSAEELANLRRRPALRQRLDALLSPRHVYLPPHARPGALAALSRAGIPIRPPSEPPDPYPAQTLLAPGEIADLLSAALAAQSMGWGAGVSPDLIEKLSAMLPPELLRAARRRAEAAAASSRPPAPYSPPAEPGTVPGERVEALQRAADRETALTIWYRKAGAVRHERRRVTPLLIEQRGLGLYLLAFCHRARANRTFRLDRLLLEEEVANGHGPAP